MTLLGSTPDAALGDGGSIARAAAAERESAELRKLWPTLTGLEGLTWPVAKEDSCTRLAEVLCIGRARWERRLGTKAWPTRGQGGSGSVTSVLSPANERPWMRAGRYLEAAWAATAPPVAGSVPLAPIPLLQPASIRSRPMLCPAEWPGAGPNGVPTGTGSAPVRPAAGDP